MARCTISRPARVSRLRAVLLGSLCLLAASMPARAQFTGDFSLQKHALDAENFLDWKAYQVPFPWRYEALRAPNLFRGTVGSLSQKKFYFAEEVRLEKVLGANGSIHYAQREDAFYRPDPVYREIELRLRSGDFSASIVGFPQHDKVNGHQGFAVALGDRTRWNYLRLTRMDQYRLFNQERTGEEHFSVEPEFHRLEARYFWDDRVLFDLTLVDERPTELTSPESDDPAAGRRERYRGRKGELQLDVHWSPTLVTGLQARGQLERRERLPHLATSAVAAAGQEIRYGWLDAYAVLTLAGGSVVEAGAYRGAFSNRIESELAAERFDHELLTDAAYIVWTLPRSDWFHWLFSFQAGRAELRKLDAAEPELAENAATNELKAGVGVVLQEEGSYRVLFNSTWDLDLFDQRQWDGGNVQLLWLF